MKELIVLYNNNKRFACHCHCCCSSLALRMIAQLFAQPSIQINLIINNQYVEMRSNYYSSSFLNYKNTFCF